MSIYETPHNATAWKESFKSFIRTLADEYPETLKAIRANCFDDGDGGRLIDAVEEESHEE